MTFYEWIANHWTGTTTYWIVIGGLALSTITADAGAWIDTLGVDASLILGTIRAERTFGATTLTLWIAEEARQTFANSLIALYFAHCICAARCWIAWVTTFLWYVYYYDWRTLDESIATVA